ncbi:MAG: efflux RND transporter permease subunit [Pseudomonadota bacterium]
MSSAVRWFIANPIAANLLMVLLVIGGLLGVPALNKQFFPDVEINQVSVAVSYPGAGPREIEEQIVLRIEEAVHDLPGIKELRSTAQQGLGQVFIEAEIGYDIQRLTANVKNRVDGISTFPSDAERPTVSELAFRHMMVTATVYGAAEERALKEIAEDLRDDLSAQPWVSTVEVSKPRPYEVSIELSEFALRRLKLTLNEVVMAIRASSLSLPAGSIKADGGDIQLQTRGQAYRRADFEQIVLRTRGDGTQVLLGEVATIRDGFADVDIRTRFNNLPSHNLTVFVSENPNVLRTSAVVHRWAEEQRRRLPAGVELDIWRDASTPFRGRVETLLKNGLGGLALVFIVLMLFLRPRLAMWVTVGIGVAFLGALFLLQYTPVSLNMLSLFAFLLILGIVVDDAIIVGEAVHSRQAAGLLGEPGAEAGALGVLKPVVYAVISTMIFFVPMFFLPGDMAQAAMGIPVVVLLALFFSLVESLLILPSHLAHMPAQTPSRFQSLRRLGELREQIADSMVWLAESIYRPLLTRALSAYPIVCAAFLFAFLLSIGLFFGDWIKTGFFPTVNSDRVDIAITMPEGGAYRDTLAVLARVEIAAEQLKAEYNEMPEHNRDGPAIGHIYSRAESSSLEVTVELRSDTVDSREFARQWEVLVGDVPEAKALVVDFTINQLGKPISLVVTADSVDQLRVVSKEIEQALSRFDGVYNIGNSLDSPRDEIVLGLKPAAETFGISLADLARQVREGFYGAEAQRIPREREDVRVMVRYPERERLSVDSLNNLRIRTSTGTEIPFHSVAEVSFEPGYQRIERLNRQRVLEVTADVAAGGAEPRSVVERLLLEDYPEWRRRYPNMTLKLDGELQEEAAFRASMLKLMGLAMLVIYALMAIPFRSYWQPLLVLTAVPFGIMGAIFGHLILNWEISIFSMMGVIACAGVVVNDNLVLIDRINQLRSAEYKLLDALIQGGVDRFRPIILTSLTTFVGLLPIMSETSVQAQFLIPMVTSLAFGVLFATGVTLFLVPSLYLLGNRFANSLARSSSAEPDSCADLTVPRL